MSEVAPLSRSHVEQRVVVPLWAGSILCMTLLTLPLFLVDFPPLADYSGHLARAYIALNIDRNAELQSLYTIDWRLLPNLGGDAILYLLGHFVSVQTAGRIFIGLCLVLTVSGAAVLNRVAFGRWSWWPLITSLVAYNGALTAGFISFSLAAGLLLFGIALWIGTVDRAPIVRVLANGTFALLLYLCHGFTLGLYGLVVGGYELYQAWQRPNLDWRQTLTELPILVAPFVLPAALFIGYGFNPDGQSALGQWTIASKLRGAIMPTLTYELWLDALTLLVLVGIPAWLFWGRRIALAPGLVPGVLLLMTAFVLLPSAVFGAFVMGDRTSIAAVLVALAAIQPRSLSRRAQIGLTAGLVLLLAVRIGVVSANWLEADRYFQRLAALTDRIEPGAAVLLVAPSEGDIWANRFAGHPSWHYYLVNHRNLPMLAHLPLAQRATFTPGHFTHPRQHILSVDQPWRELDVEYGGLRAVSDAAFVCGPDGSLSLAPSLAEYDYLVIFYLDHLAPEDRSKLEALEPVHATEDLMLLDVDRLPVGATDRTHETADRCAPL